MDKILFQQYEYLKESRNVLLNYCSTFKNEDFIHEFQSFGRGSIRNLLVHIINTYEFWLRNFPEQAELSFIKAEDVTDINSLCEKFKIADFIVVEFLILFRGKIEEPFTGKLNGKEISITPLKLFTHILTHEFHHKGQILSMSRQLGYTPVDTDIIR